ncbi:MAG: phosphoadenylyl-sulfate reductase [Candidatus Omnitrophica bacterium]|nr:phosphoadenylyl-sulfate reductase [Candidatus Omnitrophota bacterium]
MNKKLDLEKLNREFENKTPQEIIVWAVKEFSPEIATTSSFGTTSAVLLHMAAQAKPDIRVLFLETGFHFPETLKFRDELAARLKLNVVNLKSVLLREEFKSTYGNLYEKNPDKCCFLNKVEPLKIALTGLKAWITAVRRGQTENRKNVQFVEEYEDGLYKINPLATWTSGHMWDYLKTHNLPHHPLFEEGYTSIGCAPCTHAIRSGEDERAGRWSGSEKTECGIHTFMKKKQNSK